MKVLDVTEFYSERGGGVRSHLTTKGHVLCQLGHEHLVVAPGPRDAEVSLSLGPAVKDGTHPPGAAPRVVRIQGPSLPYDPTYHLLFRLDKVRRRVTSERPQVLEIHSPYLAAAAALACPKGTYGVRTFTWHSDFIDTYLRVALEARVATSLADVALAPLWGLVRGIAGRCDATFVAARWQADKLRQHGVRNVVQLPFGIEHHAFRPDARSEARRRELLGPGREDAVLLVGLGRFALEKRWDVVIDAFRRVRAQTNAVLVLFGDGPERGRLEARARAHGLSDVRFPGFEKDRGRLASALASADALVHGCPYETFGLSIAEAMGCGLPVVVPDAGGAAELAEGEGAAASETYRALDPEACAAAIGRLLGRDREALRGHAFATAARMPDETTQFTALCDAYRDLLQERKLAA